MLDDEGTVVEHQTRTELYLNYRISVGPVPSPSQVSKHYVSNHAFAAYFTVAKNITEIED